jgi:hypothetical protein
MSSDMCAQEVAALVEWIDRDQAPRRQRALDTISLYEGRRINALDPAAYGSAIPYAGQDYERLYMNAGRMIVHGIVAKVAGRLKPKCQMIASGADWPTKLRAKRLEKFVEAQMSQAQGRYRDTWSLALRAFQDACIAIGRGTLKVFADHDEGKVTVERVLPWETFTDARETRSGARPYNRFQRSYWQRDTLVARWPEFADQIMTAEATQDFNHAPGARRNAESVPVYEAWRLPFGEKKPGRHVICIKGCVLESDEWLRDEFPFVDVYWTEEFLGDGGTSLLEEIQPSVDEINYTAERMREMEKLAGNVYGSYEEGTVDPELLKLNENGIWIPRQAGSPPPTFTIPTGFGPSTIQWFELNWSKCFQLSGASEASTTSRKEPGVTSGVALRTVAAIETERFSVQANAYEHMCGVDIPRHIIACTRELAEKDPKFSARWPGKNFLEEIPWKEADLDEDMYVIQPAAVGGVVNTPQDRLQLGQDLFNAGIIGRDAFLRVIEFKDVESEIQRQGTQYSLVERYIEQWRNATPESQEDGTFRYRAPIPFMNHAAAIVQVAEAYMAAELDGAPDFNLHFFVDFMRDCDAQIQKVAAQNAALQAQARGPVPGAPAPMGDTGPAPGNPAAMVS